MKDTRKSDAQTELKLEAWSYTCPSVSWKLSRVIGSVLPGWRNPSSFEEVYFLSTHLMSNNGGPPTYFQLGPVISVTGCFVTLLVYAEVKTDTSATLTSTTLAFLQNPL